MLARLGSGRCSRQVETEVDVVENECSRYVQQLLRPH